MRWHVHSERSLYQDQWLDIRSADVELPDGQHLDHRVIYCAPGAGVVVTNDNDEVLLIWRHRFITDTWAYEIPIGGIDPGEKAVEAAARECEEETGWRPGPLNHLIYVQPSNGLINAEHHIFHADHAIRTSQATENIEASRIDWVPLAKISALIAERKIVGGTTVAALLCVLSAVGFNQAG